MKQRIKEIEMCFREQFIKQKVPSSERERMIKYMEITDYLDYLYLNYEKMGLFK